MSGTKTRGAPEPATMTRQAVAVALGVHRDTVSHLLHEGLASAVLDFGGAGKPMLFRADLVRRWALARACRRDGGRQCRTCWRVLEDCQGAAEHALENRHALGGCPDCTIDWPVEQPCADPGTWRP